MVSREQLEALAATVPLVELPVVTGPGRLDVGEWLARHGVEATGPLDWGGHRKWILPVCPWNPDHTNRSAYVVQFAGGAIAAGCHHNGCVGKGWADLRELFEPGYMERHAAYATGATNGNGHGHASRPGPSPGSPSHIGTGLGTADDAPADWDVLRTWELPEPAPRRFAVAGIIPDRVVTQFYGDGGQGKSYIALALATHAALGLAFAGLAVERRAALYIDAELDGEEFVRRAYRMARGLGYDCPPEGLYYWQLPGPLSDERIQAQAAAIVRSCGATFVVVDSLTIATYGADPKEAPEVIRVLKAMERWGAAVLAIDHIPKPQPGANLSQYRAFGTVFKGNIARSAIQVVQADGGGVALRQTKANFSAKADPIYLALAFEGDRVTVAPITSDDGRMAGIDQHLPAVERVALALADRPDGATADELAGDLDISKKTVKNCLTTLKQRDRAVNSTGRWRLVGPVPSPDAYGDRDSEIHPDEYEEGDL